MSDAQPTDDSKTPMAGRQDVGAGRLRLNLLANGGLFVLRLGIGIWYAPYLIQQLGRGLYSFVPLATQLVEYMSLATVALGSTAARYLTMDLARGDTPRMQRTYSTVLYATWLIAACLLPVCLLLAWLAPRWLAVPTGSETPVMLLFMAASVAFLGQFAAYPYEVTATACNRLDQAALVRGNQLLLRVLGIVLLFTLFGPSLPLVGVAMLVASAVTFAQAWRVSYRLLPELRVHWRNFDGALCRSMMGMTGWITVNQMGSMLFLNVDLLIINQLLGPVAAGSYAALLQWGLMFRLMLPLVARALGPTIQIHYARGEMARVLDLTRRAVALSGLAMGLPIGLVAGLSRPLLSTWLTPDDAALAPLLVVMVVHLSVNLSVQPMFAVQQAANKIRVPGLVSLAMGALNLALALVLAGPVGWGLYGVAAASAIVLSAKNLVFTPWYVARIMGAGPGYFLRPLLTSLGACLALTGAGWWLSGQVTLAGWPALLLAGAALALPYTLLCWGVLLGQQDRQLLRRLILGRLGRKSP